MCFSMCFVCPLDPLTAADVVPVEHPQSLESPAVDVPLPGERERMVLDRSIYHVQIEGV